MEKAKNKRKGHTSTKKRLGGHLVKDRNICTKISHFGSLTFKKIIS